MTRFVVLVEFKRDDHERDNRYDFSEVEVLAVNEVDADLTAAQMVACRPGLTVTRTFPSC